MVATKDQERQALKKIKNIVEALGDDSYIAMAFDGAFELAEENIENDWGCSCRWYKENYEKVEKQNKGIRDESDSKERHLVDCIKQMEDELTRKESIISEQEMKIEELEMALNQVGEEKFDKSAEIRVLKEKLGFAQNEIVKLKAKLFDLMFSGD